MERGVRALAIAAVAAVCLAPGVSPLAAGEDEPELKEQAAEIAERVLRSDAEDGRTLARLVSRKRLGGALLDLETFERDPQRAWLARTLGRLFLAVHEDPFRRRSPSPPVGTANYVVGTAEYMKDSALVFGWRDVPVEKERAVPEPDPFDRFAVPTSAEPSDPPPPPPEEPIEALLRVAAARARGDGGAFDDAPILERLVAAVDGADLPTKLRMRAVVALADHRARTLRDPLAPDAPRTAGDERLATDDALRMIRAIAETRGAPPEAYAALAVNASPAAAQFLTEVAFGARLRIDGTAAAHAEAALRSLETAHPRLVAETRAALLRPTRVFEAESEPLLHSTGAAEGDGWAARRGRDKPQHMVYGPYVSDLAPRRHVARFRFRIDAAGDAPLSAEILRLEATSAEAERAGTPITARSVTIRQAPVGTWREFDVERMPDPAPMKMEFRVWWPGNCDVTVDRIELLTVPEATAEVAAPERAEAPEMSRRGATRLRPARFLLTRVLDSMGDEYDRLARAFCSDPQSAKAAIDEATAPPTRESRSLSQSQRRRIEILRRRIDCAEEFAALHAAHDAAMSWYESRRNRGNPDDHARIDLGPLHRRDLEAGRILIPIGKDPGTEPARDGPPILPASPLWRYVFAEIWLTGSRPMTNRPGSDLTTPPDDVELPGGGRRVLPFSTVGHRRLHALLQLAWLEPDTWRDDLAELASEPSATIFEREAAARALVRSR